MNKATIKREIKALKRIRLRAPSGGGDIKPFVYCTSGVLFGARVVHVDLLTWYADTLDIPALIYGDRFNVDLWEDCFLEFIVDPHSPHESWRLIYHQIRTLLNGGIIRLPFLGVFSKERAFGQVCRSIKAFSRRPLFRDTY